jgi:trimeric autotransporter adhesin
MMALKVGGTTVINDNRGIENITNIKTINGQSIIGDGDLTITGSSSFGYGIVLNTEDFLNIKVGAPPHKFGTMMSEGNFRIGSFALDFNKDGRYCLAIGRNALRGSLEYINSSDTSPKNYNNVKGNTGSYNIAVGTDALRENNSGENNIAIGSSAMRNNISASYTIAIGDTAFGGTAGRENIAIGNETLTKNTIYGEYNITIGNESLRFNSSGRENLAVGFRSLQHNSEGYNNIAIGHRSMGSWTEGTLEPSDYNGSNNLAIGSGALSVKKGGGANIAIGHSSLKNLREGFGNISIGESAPHATSAHNITHSPVFNVVNDNNRIVMGHTSITNAYIQVPWTVVSDERDKINFTAVPHGLEFVEQLKPTAYQFRKSRDSEETNGGVRYGFKAQDIAAIEPEGVIVDTTNPEKLYYNEGNMVPVLVKALQELSEINKKLEQRIALLESK